MTSIRFIHAADLHLDSPFKGLTNIPKNMYQYIRQSTFLAFENIIEHCIEKKVDFLLISGDVYDLQDRSLKAQIHLLRGLERLGSYGIHTYIIHGNHDSVDQAKAELKWPSTVHFFSAEKVETVLFMKENKIAAKILGRSYPNKAFKDNIVNEYQVQDSIDTFNIGLLHTNVDGDPAHDTYAPCKLSELLNSDVDYWALGHIHKGQILSEKSPAIIYPGNTQGRHINEAGSKGCVLVDAVNQSIKSLEWLPTARIFWEKVEIDISEASDINDLISIIQEKSDQLVSNAEAPLIIRIYLQGKTSLHVNLLKEDRINELQEIVNESFTAQPLWVWVESIILKTQPFVSLEEILVQESFLADFLFQLKEIKQDISIEDIKEITKELFNHRGIKKYLPYLSAEDVNEIFELVANKAIDFLLEGERIS